MLGQEARAAVSGAMSTTGSRRLVRWGHLVNACGRLCSRGVAFSRTDMGMKSHLTVENKKRA